MHAMHFPLLRDSEIIVFSPLYDPCYPPLHSHALGSTEPHLLRACAALAETGITRDDTAA